MSASKPIIVHRTNLRQALYDAIVAQTAYEKRQFGPTYSSALLAGWKTLLEQLNDLPDGRLEIRPYD